MNLGSLNHYISIYFLLCFPIITLLLSLHYTYITTSDIVLQVSYTMLIFLQFLPCNSIWKISNHFYVWLIHLPFQLFCWAHLVNFFLFQWFYFVRISIWFFLKYLLDSLFVLNIIHLKFLNTLKMATWRFFSGKSRIWILSPTLSCSVWVGECI